MSVQEQTVNLREPQAEAKLLQGFIDDLSELGCEMSCLLTGLKEQPVTPELLDEIDNVETQLNLIKTEISAYQADLTALDLSDV